MSAVVAAAASGAALAKSKSRQQYNNSYNDNLSSSSSSANNSSLKSLTAVITGGSFQYSLVQPTFSRYDNQKRRDWNIFCQFLRKHSPPLVLSRCSGAHVIEFLRHLDQFGKMKVHCENCRFFGESQSSSLLIRSCPCPLRQGWGNLDAMVGRLRAAFEENGGSLETNPFGSHTVKLYLREVRQEQATAVGIITY